MKAWEICISEIVNILRETRSVPGVKQWNWLENEETKIPRRDARKCNF